MMCCHCGANLVQDGNRDFVRGFGRAVNGGSDLLLSAFLLISKGMKPTISIHAGREVQTGDVGRGRVFQPNSLPNAGAGRVEDMSGPSGLLAIWDVVGPLVCGIEDENKPVAF